MRKGQKSRIRASRTDIAVQVIVYMIVIAVCLIIILPCLNVLVLAFNDGKDAARGGIWFWPRVPTFDNIKEVFKDGSIVRAYGYTIARTVIGTVLSLTVTTLAAFSLKQKDLPGNKLITLNCLFQQRRMIFCRNDYRYQRRFLQTIPYIINKIILY